MDKQYPTVTKIPVLDIGKFEQWQFLIQQYLQHEHYALWKVIEFEDSNVVPESSPSTTTTDTTSGETGTKSGRTVTLTTKDMQRNKNDATKKTKKNLLKQQYGNFKAEGSETLEQTFTRLQVIIGQLEFMDVEIEQDDLNKKFLTNDLYNHLKVYESEVQKKLDPNSHNMAFISSAKHSSGNKDGNTACVSTASTNVPTASASVATISQDTACAYIASQSSGSQIKFEVINQIDEDVMEEMDIKWNMALLSMRADKFWKKIGKKISIQGLDMAGFDKLKVECFNCHMMGHFARECRAPRSQDRGRRDNYRQGSKAEEQALKYLMAIDRMGWDWSYMENDEEDHALVADEVAPIEFTLMANTSAESKKLETLKLEKDGVDGKLAGLLKASNDLDNLIKSQRKRVRKSFTPKPVAHRPYIPSQRPVRTNMNGARPNITSFNKQTHSYGNKTFHRTSAVRLPYRAPWVPTVNRYFPPVNRKFSTGSRKFPTDNRKFPTASRKFPTGSTKSPTADMRMRGKAVKPSACWFWKPLLNLSNKGPKNNSVSVMFKKYIYIDTQGRLKHITRNISYLSDYEPFNGGYVSFGRGGCKITGKRTIKTGKLEFENVYFVKDLKFTWTFFLKSKDETSGILKKFITKIENLKDLKMKIIRCDNRGEFRNKEMNDLCSQKGIKREFSNASTPQQNGVAERRNRTLIEAARTMLADAKLPVTFWAQAVNTACYVQNKLLVNKSHNKTPYELFNGSGNPNPTASTSNPPADQMETLTVETPIPTDPEFPAKGYKVEKAMYGLHQAPKAWYGILSKYLLKNSFQRVLQKEDGIFLSQDKYVGDILKKFGYLDVRSSNTPTDKENPWGKDRTGKDVDLHLYRSMIGSLMYLTASRPDIMFAVCACARHQVTPKECQLQAVKRIFRYLKSHPKLGLWYPKESPFELLAYSDSDYGGATQDLKSTTRGC
nr:uncharacterized mitochondrial protein AtMg00810-like [Tanacetum cinerariifolium]